jgi:hypothetical protein
VQKKKNIKLWKKMKKKTESDTIQNAVCLFFGNIFLFLTAGCQLPAASWQDKVQLAAGSRAAFFFPACRLLCGSWTLSWQQVKKAEQKNQNL